MRLPIVLGITCGILFSLVILLNLFHGYLDPHFFYLPIFKEAGDDFAHYPFVGKFLGGQFPVLDAYIYENRDRLTFYFLSRNLTTLLTAIGGIFTHNIFHAYLFNYFFYPALNFVLLYFLIVRFTSNKMVSAAIAACILIGYRYTALYPVVSQLRNFASMIQQGGPPYSTQLNEFVRSQGLMISNLGILAFCLSLYSFLKNPNKKNMWWVGTLLGLSSYIYPTIGMICGSVFGSFFLYFFPQREIRKKLFFCLGIALLLELPLFYAFAIQTMHFPSFQADFLDATHATFGFLSSVHWKSLCYTLIWGTILFLLAKGPDKTILRLTLLGLVLIYCLGHIFLGRYIGERIAVRGFQPLWLALNGVIFYHLLLNFFTTKRAVSILKGASVVILFGSLTTGLWMQVWAFQNKRDLSLDKREISELMSWLKENTRSEEVVVSLDPHILLFSPLFTPLYAYVAPRTLNPSTKQERWDRFYESMALCQIAPQTFRQMLENNYEGPLRNKQEANAWNLILFWSEFGKEEGKLPAILIHELVHQYEVFLKQWDGRLKYKANYLIVSEDQMEGKGTFSVAKKSVENFFPLAKINKFYIYKTKS